MKTVTTWEVNVDRLDSDGRYIGNETVSTGITDEAEAQKVAAQWNNCDMLHGEAYILRRTKEVPEHNIHKKDSEPLFSVAHIITFSDNGKKIMKNALACVVENAHNDEHTYINYVKVCGKMDAELMIGIANLVSDEIAASGTIHVTNENKMVMLCGLNIYGNKLIDQKRDIQNNAEEHAHISTILKNVLTMISQMSTGVM